MLHRTHAGAQGDTGCIPCADSVGSLRLRLPLVSHRQASFAQRPALDLRVDSTGQHLLPELPRASAPYQEFYLERLGSPAAVAAHRVRVRAAGDATRDGTALCLRPHAVPRLFPSRRRHRQPKCAAVPCKGSGVDSRLARYRARWRAKALALSLTSPSPAGSRSAYRACTRTVSRRACAGAPSTSGHEYGGARGTARLQRPMRLRRFGQRESLSRRAVDTPGKNVAEQFGCHR